MTDTIESKDSASFKRLKWQCRRGMLELDVLFEPFLEDVFLTLDEEDRQRFYQLIECEDQEIFPWFMQKEVPEDPDLARIVHLILTRVQPENYRRV
ncbi:Antitoxin CptB [Marinomonas aquimarina]|uniref:FAD assembly factor SdhE n=1 Tax=Marinomonas aquimarina TaxID=295068 RepID=A0A1A8T9J9_9GAMM|nr:succinate dehydrogenase assembly factor 2 [Marinomonas aquimarina]SBS28280.1 Antitoxin CptB [Marinomonas aquimarina]